MTKIAPGLFHSAGPPIQEIKANIVAILTARNEGWRIPFWLAYHRWLGVDHFIIIDNRSTDRTAAILREQHDVTLIDAPGNYRKSIHEGGRSNFRDWIRTALSMGPAERWNLILDADELFVGVPWRQGGLRKTVSALEAQQADFAFALMVDCYPASLPLTTDMVSAVPWDRAPWFDAGPYGRWRRSSRKLRLSYNGVRERICWPNWKRQKFLPRVLRKLLGISPPPFIVKAPLVRGSADATHGVHATLDRRHADSHFDILHYKFDIDLALKTQSALTERQYFNDSVEYEAYAAAFAGGRLELKAPVSRRFSGLTSLSDAGLCHFTNSLLARLETDGLIDTPLDQATAEIFRHGDRHLSESILLSEVLGAAAGTVAV